MLCKKLIPFEKTTPCWSCFCSISTCTFTYPLPLLDLLRRVVPILSIFVAQLLPQASELFYYFGCFHLRVVVLYTLTITLAEISVTWCHQPPSYSCRPAWLTCLLRLRCSLPFWSRFHNETCRQQPSLCTFQNGRRLP